MKVLIIVIVFLVCLFASAFAGELEDKRDQLIRAIAVIRIQREYLNQQFRELGRELKALKWDLQQVEKEIGKSQEEKKDEKPIAPDS